MIIATHLPKVLAVVAVCLLMHSPPSTASPEIWSRERLNEPFFGAEVRFVGDLLNEERHHIGGTAGFPFRDGVLVTSVAPNSPAERSSVRAHDVIFEIGNIRILSLENFHQAIATAIHENETPIRYRRLMSRDRSPTRPGPPPRATSRPNNSPPPRRYWDSVNTVARIDTLREVIDLWVKVSRQTDDFLEYTHTPPRSAFDPPMPHVLPVIRRREDGPPALHVQAQYAGPQQIAMTIAELRAGDTHAILSFPSGSISDHQWHRFIPGDPQHPGNRLQIEIGNVPATQAIVNTMIQAVEYSQLHARMAGPLGERQYNLGRAQTHEIYLMLMKFIDLGGNLENIPPPAPGPGERETDF